MTFAAMLLCGLLIDTLLGWPERIYNAIGHPVTWLGRLIDALEARGNSGGRRRRLVAGAITAGLVLLAAVAPAAGVQSLLPAGPTGWLLGGILAWPLIAARSLHTHVAAVAEPLARADLSSAREAVSQIVGRDPSSLDVSGIARATVESLAENSSDGVLAPIFWGVVAGLPGIAAYKAINTMDSMIGHRTARYEAFGKAAARLDDVANWIPARLMGLLISLSVGNGIRRAVRTMLRDAHNHRSPNAGWPESAMAGALEIRLSGPRTYEDRVVAEPWLNEGARDPDARDVVRALGLYRRAVLMVGVILLILASL